MNDDDDHDPSTIGDSLGGSRFRYFWLVVSKVFTRPRRNEKIGLLCPHPARGAHRAGFDGVVWTQACYDRTIWPTRCRVSF